MFRTEDNKYIVGCIYNGTHIKIDDYGNIFPAKLFGRLTNDLNANCRIDANEPPFRGQTMVAAYKSTTNETYYGNIDSTGKYLFDLDTGRFIVNLVMPFNNYWSNCTPSVSKTLLNISAVDT